MPRTSRTSTSPTSSGFVLLPIGIALTTLSRTLEDWGRGLLLGAGVALILIATALLGASIGSVRDKGQGWLPSRDGDG